MISLLVYIAILGLVYWAVNLFPIPAPFPVIMKVLFVAFAVLLILQFFGVDTGIQRIR